MTYSNVNNFIIIEADNRDPNISFANHRKRKSYGGVDCVAKMRTRIYAPDDCITTNIPNNGSGGNTVRLSFEGGWIDEMMHFDQLVEPGFKTKGDLIGYSGDTGSPGQPHVHWHRIGPWYNDAWGSTNRYNPFHYFTSTPAGEVGEEIQEDDMENTCIIITAGAPDNWAFYWFDAVKNKKRLIPTDEWNQLRKWNEENGLELVTYPLEVNNIHGLKDF